MVGPPLWKIWKSIGMMIPNIWENKIDVPNHQPVSYCHIVSIDFTLFLYCIRAWHRHTQTMNVLAKGASLRQPRPKSFCSPMGGVCRGSDFSDAEEPEEPEEPEDSPCTGELMAASSDPSQDYDWWSQNMPLFVFGWVPPQEKHVMSFCDMHCVF